ncbi:MAG: hypothetical protein V4732_15840 [Pseudomonadota bacterium]
MKKVASQFCKLIVIGGSFCSAIVTVPALAIGSSDERRLDAALNLNSGFEDLNSKSVYPTDKEGIHSANNLLGVELKLRQSSNTVFQFTGYAMRVTELKSLGPNDAIITEEKYISKVGQAFVSHRFMDNYKLTIGRQRVLWGHGLSYVPSDFINPPLEPESLDLVNARGVDAIVLDYFLAKNNFTFIVNKNNNMERAGVGGKWTSNLIDSLDFNLVYYNSAETGNALGLSFSADPQALIGESQGQFNVTANIALRERSQYPVIVYEVLPEYLTTKVGPLQDEKNSPFLTYLIGGSYEFIESRLSLRSEFYYIEDAYSQEDLQGIYHSLLTASYANDSPYGWLNVLAFGRNQQRYFNLTLNRETHTEGSENHFTNTLSYGIGLTRGLEDHSELISLNINSSYFDAVELSLDILVPQGKSDTEFGTMPFNWRASFGMKYIF